MKNNILTLLLLHLAVLGFAQNSLTNNFTYEVNRVHPPFSTSKEKLSEIKSIVDLNKHYKSSWIKEFVSVEVVATSQGETRKAGSKNDTFTKEQKDLMKMADEGTDIAVKVRYFPDNTLSQNDVKEFDFTFMVNPENEAQYINGQQKLRQYIKEEVIDKIPAGTFEGYDLSTVKFTVDEAGEIVDAHVYYWPSKNKEIDNLLLESVCKMPTWKPAAYKNGLKIKQEFVVTIGNHENCVLNTLNIYR